MKTIRGSVKPPQWYFDESGTVYHRENSREVLVDTNGMGMDIEPYKEWEYEEETFTPQEFNRLDMAEKLSQSGYDIAIAELIERGVL